jgi:hypothetical protein
MQHLRLGEILFGGRGGGGAGVDDATGGIFDGGHEQTMVFTGAKSPTKIANELSEKRNALMERFDEAEKYVVGVRTGVTPSNVQDLISKFDALGNEIRILNSGAADELGMVLGNVSMLNDEKRMKNDSARNSLAKLLENLTAAEIVVENIKVVLASPQDAGQASEEEIEQDLQEQPPLEQPQDAGAEDNHRKLQDQCKHRMKKLLCNQRQLKSLCNCLHNHQYSHHPQNQRPQYNHPQRPHHHHHHLQMSQWLKPRSNHLQTSQHSHHKTLMQMHSCKIKIWPGNTPHLPCKRMNWP